MKRLFPIILFLFLVVSIAKAEEICVVASHDNELGKLSHKQLVDLYMGKKGTLNTNGEITPLDLSPDSVIRAKFYRKLIGKSVAQVNAYWARLLFTGRATPPKTVEGSSAVLEFVRQNKGAVGYVNREDVDETVKVIASVQ